jgi:hypothetical protein
MGEINKQLGLTEIYQHDFDDHSKRCKKCHKTLDDLMGGLKVCAVIGREEVARFRDNGL